MTRRFHFLHASLWIFSCWALSATAVVRFEPGATFEVGLRASTVALGDLNNDTHPDLAVANIFGDSISVAYNDGNGGFGQRSEVPLANGLKHPVAVTVGDLDGDEYGDMVAVQVQNIENSQNPLNSSGVVFFFGKADGTFDQTSTPIIGVPSSVLIADLNGDTRNDVIVGNNGDLSFSAEGIGQFDGGVYPFLNQGSRNFNPATPIVDEDQIGSIVDVVVMDYDKDGRQDVIGIDQGALYLDETFNLVLLDPKLTTFKGGTAGLAIGNPRILELKPWSLSSADFNKDERMDLAIAIVGDMNEVSSFLGTNASVDLYANESGLFTLLESVPVPGVAFNVQAADFDKDGDADFAVSVQEIRHLTSGNELTPTLRVFENMNGTFVEAGSFPVDKEPRYAASGDLDHDGDIDLVVLCTVIDSEQSSKAVNGKVYLFLNQGGTEVSGWSIF